MNSKHQYIVSLEKQTQEIIIKQLLDSTEPVIMDIGSCEGESSIRYAKQYPKSIIYAFEPLSNNYSIILNNIEKYNVKNIKPTQLCLSDNKGKSIFYVSSGRPEDANTNDDWNYGNKSSSLLSPEKAKDYHSWLKFDSQIEVETDTLYNFCIADNMNKIDFVHMDVQGAELLELNGAQDMLSNINMIWLEVEAVELYKNQPLKKDIEIFLSKHNFIKIKDTVYGSRRSILG